MNTECTLRPDATLDVAEVAKIASAFKSLAAYSMLAYDHDDDPTELTAVIEEGLTSVNKLFDC